jgi:hypothetical protein
VYLACGIAVYEYSERVSYLPNTHMIGSFDSLSGVKSYSFLSSAAAWKQRQLYINSERSSSNDICEKTNEFKWMTGNIEHYRQGFVYSNIVHKLNILFIMIKFTIWNKETFAVFSLLSWNKHMRPSRCLYVCVSLLLTFEWLN